MEMLCSSSVSSMCPIRMSLPLCWMGGLASIRLTRSSASPPNQFVTLMRPVTCTSDELPVRTLTLPEPVVRSRLTGPVTCRVRWNEPSDEAAASNRATANRNKRNARDRLTERYDFDLYELDLDMEFLPKLSSFVAQRVHRRHLGCALRGIHAGRKRNHGKR